MKKAVLAALAASWLANAVHAPSAEAASADAEDAAAQPDPAAHAWAEKNLRGWPVEARALAAVLVTRYGEPDERSSDRIAWYGKGPWKRTVLHRQGIPHDFPGKHQDFLEQTIDYRFPIDRLDELADYNGSIVAHRTAGELTVRCESEEANFLAVNLAHELAQGTMNIEQVKGRHAQVMRGVQLGTRDREVRGLKFTVAQGGSADPGEISPLMRHLEYTEIPEEVPTVPEGPGADGAPEQPGTGVEPGSR